MKIGDEMVIKGNPVMWDGSNWVDVNGNEYPPEAETSELKFEGLFSWLKGESYKPAKPPNGYQTLVKDGVERVIPKLPDEFITNERGQTTRIQHSHQNIINAPVARPKAAPVVAQFFQEVMHNGARISKSVLGIKPEPNKQEPLESLRIAFLRYDKINLSDERITPEILASWAVERHNNTEEDLRLIEATRIEKLAHQVKLTLEIEAVLRASCTKITPETIMGMPQKYNRHKESWFLETQGIEKKFD